MVSYPGTLRCSDLIAHLVDDCLRFASPVLLATEKNEQFNKNIRSMITKTNRLNPSNDLAHISGREVMLRSIAMGLCWENGTETGGQKVQEWYDRNGENMFFNANREYGSAEYVSGKRVAQNLVAVFDLDFGLSTERRFLGKVVLKKGTNVIVEVYELIPKRGFYIYADDSLAVNYQTDEDGNLLACQTFESLDLLVERLSVVELLDMVHTTVIEGIEYSIISRCKLGTYLWIHNTNNEFRTLENASQ